MEKERIQSEMVPPGSSKCFHETLWYALAFGGCVRSARQQ